MQVRFCQIPNFLCVQIFLYFFCCGLLYNVDIILRKSKQLKGPCHQNIFFSFMKDVNLLNIMHKVNIPFSSQFSFKFADLAENVRLEGAEKQAIVSCSKDQQQQLQLFLRGSCFVFRCSPCCRRLIVYIFGPLQETYCLFLWPATEDSLPGSLACFRRLLPVFSGRSSLTFSAKSANLELKGGKHENFCLCMMFKKVISLIHEKIYFGDRVPLFFSLS